MAHVHAVSILAFVASRALYPSARIDRPATAADTLFTGAAAISTPVTRGAGRLAYEITLFTPMRTAVSPYGLSCHAPPGLATVGAPTTAVPAAIGFGTSGLTCQVPLHAASAVARRWGLVLSLGHALASLTAIFSPFASIFALPDFHTAGPSFLHAVHASPGVTRRVERDGFHADPILAAILAAFAAVLTVDDLHASRALLNNGNHTILLVAGAFVDRDGFHTHALLATVLLALTAILAAHYGNTTGLLPDIRDHAVLLLAWGRFNDLRFHALPILAAILFTLASILALADRRAIPYLLLNVFEAF